MNSLSKQILKSKLFEQNKRIGVEPFRSYYIPFSINQKFDFDCGIIKRESSDLFLSLDGEWDFEDYPSIQSMGSLDCNLNKKIKVPSCVQIEGFDYNQYVNYKYNFSYNPPFIDKDIPTFHYRKKINLNKNGKIPYLCFDGVDCSFYLFINGKFVGYSQISHSLSEFNISTFVKDGENVFDVIVLKWCASSYIEDQDKFRFSGIFRSVYILFREEKHIEDFKIITSFEGKNGILTIKNLRGSPFNVFFNHQNKTVKSQCEVSFCIPNVKRWSPKKPYLYDVILSTTSEKILQRVGFRSVKIENGIFLINDNHQKLYGINRHEFSPETGSTITREFTFNDLLLMKELNINAIRTSHYPDMPEFYELCNYLGFYVVDEADIESHGAAISDGGYKIEPWEKLANSGIYDDAVLDREKSLYERDKNHCCVIIWSLGNESSYGKMFYDGADYIHTNDDRPIHYEGLWNIADKSIDGDYYTNRIDIVSRMYPPYEWLEHGYLDDINEKRPLLLCEYSHAMGNSCGDLADYWRIINSNDRFIGAFVWEWNDHAINCDGKLLYGGDFKEQNHDSNFCIDGTVTPYRKFKSSTLEMKAVYSGNLEPKKEVNKCKKLREIPCNSPIKIKIDEEKGSLLAIYKNDKNILESPIEISYLRAYLDNEMHIKWKLEELEKLNLKIYKREVKENEITFYGNLIGENEYKYFDYCIKYKVFNNAVDIILNYAINSEVNFIPRFGVKFAINKIYQNFTYFGYGPDESYIDKRVHSKIKKFKTNVKSNYFDYIKPQETGSHYYSSYIKFDNLKILAEKPFSFSVLPYSFEQIICSKHYFELPKQDKTYINLDIFMSGVGSNSCGPELKKEYSLPHSGSNKFRIVIK